MTNPKCRDCFTECEDGELIISLGICPDCYYTPESQRPRFAKVVK